MKNADNQKDRIGACLCGVIMAWIGISGLVTGKIPQRWHGGPPLEGPLATIGSALILVAGLFVIYLSATKNGGRGGNEK